MTDLDLYEDIVRLTRQGEPFALVRMVAHQGSSPRKSGAKMLVRGDGSTMGTVGGGRSGGRSPAAETR
jgi:xanthine dehydrogenase accessory factor